jgi:hypothetical protein
VQWRHHTSTLCFWFRWQHFKRYYIHTEEEQQDFANTKFSIIRQLFKLVVLNLHNFGILKANEIKYAITIAVMVDLIVIHCLDRNGWQIAK